MNSTAPRCIRAVFAVTAVASLATPFAALAQAPSGSTSSTATPATALTGTPGDPFSDTPPHGQRRVPERAYRTEGGEAAVKGPRVDVSSVPPAYRADARRVWRRAFTLAPPAVRAAITRFTLLPRAGGGVATPIMGRGTGSANLGIGIPHRGNVDHVIVHEFGQVISMSAPHVVRGSRASGCPYTWMVTGCARPGGAMHAFVTRFWRPLMERPGFRSVTGAERERDAPTSYVTAYAATNPYEDFSETFRYFVLGDRPTATELVRDQKVALMWDHPDLVAMRNHIRRAIAAHPESKIAPLGVPRR